MRKMLLVLGVLLVGTLSVSAQDGRINPSILDIAIYCANGGVEIWDIQADGSGQQALLANNAQISAAVASTRTGGDVLVASGGNGVTLTALSDGRLRAAQGSYNFEFNNDTCGPLNLPAPTLPEGDFAPGVIQEDNRVPGAPPPAGQDLLYTIQRGDTLRIVAEKFNITTSELLAANNLANPNLIFPGQQLVVPNQAVQEAPPEAVPAAPEAPALVSENGNFLRDPSFEGQFTGRGRSDFNIPSEWGIVVSTSPRQFEWQNLVPVAFPRRTPPEIRSGSLSINLNKGYATYSAFLFQRVSVPENASLQGSIWAWYHTCDPGSQSCDNRSNPRVQVGIEPNGGTDPASPAMIWSPPISPQGSWGTTGVTAEANGGVVTMFIFASQDTPRAINELYLDDAALIVAP